MLPTETSNQPQFACNDENRHFRTDHLRKDLAGRSARGGAVTVGAQGFKFVLSTLAAIALARLLTPDDYGLIGMVAILVNFVGMFQYLGLSTATVKWAELNHQQVSTLFWINMALSAAIMLVTVGSGPLLAWFYKEPRLVGITAGYGVTILFAGLAIQRVERHAFRRRTRVVERHRAGDERQLEIAFPRGAGHRKTPGYR